jgi:hypothetical protein
VNAAEADCSTKINVDLPDLVDERQAERDAAAHQVEAGQNRPSRQPREQACRQRSDADIGDHHDRERGPEHRAPLLAGKLIGEERQRDGQ